MGREIRRVAADWEHPKRKCPHEPWRGGCSEARSGDGTCFQPLHDRSFKEAAAEWKQGFAAWESGADEDRADNPDLEFWEWHGDPPDREYYRPDWPEGAAMHYQMYETVSEGTPTTPHFATEAELVDHLVKHGDRWDQLRGNTGWARSAAEQFVSRGFAMSLMVQSSAAGVVIHEPRDGDLPEGQ